MSDLIKTTRREYQLNALQKFSYLGLAAVFLFGSCFFFKLAIDPIGRDFTLVVGGLALILGLILVSLALRSQLVIDGSQIELRSAVRTFHANRIDIEGLRRFQNQYGRWTRVCLKEGRAFNISESFTGTDDLNEWLKGLPDLDQRDANLITEQIRNDEAHRSVEKEPSEVLAQAKNWAVGLSVAAGIFSVPVLFLNQTPIYAASVVLLAMLPPLAIFLLYHYPLLFTMFKSKSEPRADLAFAIIWPGIGMILPQNMGNDPTHLVAPLALFNWFLLILVCYVFFLSRSLWQNPYRWVMILLALPILGGMYAAGVTNAANTLPDHSISHSYRTEILRMYETHGRSASYNLILAPWGPIAYSDDVGVSRRIYETVKVGDSMCIGLHPGYLHAPWYTLDPCTRPLPPDKSPVSRAMLGARAYRE